MINTTDLKKYDFEIELIELTLEKRNFDDFETLYAESGLYKTINKKEFQNILDIMEKENLIEKAFWNNPQECDYRDFSKEKFNINAWEVYLPKNHKYKFKEELKNLTFDDLKNGDLIDIEEFFIPVEYKKIKNLKFKILENNPAHKWVVGTFFVDENDISEPSFLNYVNLKSIYFSNFEKTKNEINKGFKKTNGVI